MGGLAALRARQAPDPPAEKGARVDGGQYSRGDTQVPL